MLRTVNGVVIMGKHLRSVLLLQFVLITIMTILESFPVFSIPVSSIRLAYSMQFEYGVFGWCIIYPERKCTGKRIGYKPIDTSIPDQRLLLPSESKYSVSKLLAMHIVAFALSLVMWGLIIVAMLTRLEDSPNFLLICALLQMTVFLFTLLSFLVDIMLFQANLNWPGWIILAVSITAAISGSMLWSYRRSIEMRNFRGWNRPSRSHEEDTRVYALGKGNNFSQSEQTAQIAMYPLEQRPAQFSTDESTDLSNSGMDHSQDPLTAPPVTYHGIIDEF